MRKIFAACSVLIFSACSNYSIFSKLDCPDTEIISTFSGKKLIVALEGNINSTKFYETLSEEQRDRIISSLDNFIHEEKQSDSLENLVLVSRAAIVAIDIFINSDPLVYEIIYNMANPAFVYLTDSSASPSKVFYSFTSVLRKTIKKDNSVVKPIALCFYNLYKIAEYYDLATQSSKYGGYSGGDLQKYVVSAIVSGIISGTAKAAGISSSEIKELASEIAQVYIQIEQDASQEETILQKIFLQLQSELGVSSDEIILAYKEQLYLKAIILEDIALFAGFTSFAKEAVSVLKTWGIDEESLSN